MRRGTVRPGVTCRGELRGTTLHRTGRIDSRRSPAIVGIGTALPGEVLSVGR
jgi:hypothetical protein